MRSVYMSQKQRIISGPCAEEVGPKFRCINPNNCGPELRKGLEEVAVCGPGGIGVCCPVISDLNADHCGIRAPAMLAPNYFTHALVAPTFSSRFLPPSTFPYPIQEGLFFHGALHFKSGYLSSASGIDSESSNSSLHEIHYQQPEVHVVEESSTVFDNGGSADSLINKDNSELLNKVERMIQRMGGMETICIEYPKLAKILIEELSKKCPAPALFASLHSFSHQENPDPIGQFAFYPDYETPWGRYQREIKGGERNSKSLNHEYNKTLTEMLTELHSRKFSVDVRDAEVELKPPLSVQELHSLAHGQPSSISLKLSSNMKTNVKKEHSNQTLLDNSYHSLTESVHSKTSKEDINKNLKNVDQGILNQFSSAKHGTDEKVFIRRTMRKHPGILTFPLKNDSDGEGQIIRGTGRWNISAPNFKQKNKQESKNQNLFSHEGTERESRAEFHEENSQKEAGEQQIYSNNEHRVNEEKENQQWATQKDVTEDLMPQRKMQEKTEGIVFKKINSRNNANKNNFSDGSEMWRGIRMGLGIRNSPIEVQATINDGNKMIHLDPKGWNYRSQRTEIAENSYDTIRKGISDTNQQMATKKDKTHPQQNFGLEDDQRTGNSETLHGSETIDLTKNNENTKEKGQCFESKDAGIHILNENEKVEPKEKKQYPESVFHLKNRAEDIQIQDEVGHLPTPNRIPESISASSKFEDRPEKTINLSENEEATQKTQNESLLTSFNSSSLPSEIEIQHRNLEGNFDRESKRSDIQPSSINYKERETVIPPQNENESFKLVGDKLVFHSSNLDVQSTEIVPLRRKKGDTQQKINEHFTIVKSFLKVQDKVPESVINPLNEDNSFKIEKVSESSNTKVKSEKEELKAVGDISKMKENIGARSSAVTGVASRIAVQLETEGEDSKMETEVASQSPVEERILMQAEEMGSKTKKGLDSHSSNIKDNNKHITKQLKSEENDSKTESTIIDFVSSNMKNKEFPTNTTTEKNVSRTGNDSGTVFQSLKNKEKEIKNELRNDSSATLHGYAGETFQSSNTDDKGIRIAVHPKTKENYSEIGVNLAPSKTKGKGDKIIIQQKTKDDFKTSNPDTEIIFKSLNIQKKFPEAPNIQLRNKMDVAQGGKEALEIPVNPFNLGNKAADFMMEFQNGEEDFKIEPGISETGTEYETGKMVAQYYVSLKKAGNEEMAATKPSLKDKTNKNLKSFRTYKTDLRNNKESHDAVFSFPSSKNGTLKTSVHYKNETDTLNTKEINLEITSESTNLKDEVPENPPQHRKIGMHLFKVMKTGTTFSVPKVENLTKPAGSRNETIHLKKEENAQISFHSPNIDDGITNTRSQTENENIEKNNFKTQLQTSDGKGIFNKSIVLFNDQDKNENDEKTAESELEYLNTQEKAEKEYFNQNDYSKGFKGELSFGARYKFHGIENLDRFDNNKNGNVQQGNGLLQKAIYPIPNSGKEFLQNRHNHPEIRNKEQDYIHSNEDELKRGYLFTENPKAVENLSETDYQKNFNHSISTIDSEKNTSSTYPESNNENGETNLTFVMIKPDAKDFKQKHDIFPNIDSVRETINPIEVNHSRLSANFSEESDPNKDLINRSLKSTQVTFIPSQNITRVFDRDSHINKTDSNSMNFRNHLELKNSFEGKDSLQLAQKIINSDQNEENKKYLNTEIPSEVDFASHTSARKANNLLSRTSVEFNSQSLKSDKGKAPKFQVFPVVRNKENYFSTSTDPQHSVKLFASQNFEAAGTIISSFSASDEDSGPKSLKIKTLNLNGDPFVDETATSDKILAAPNILERSNTSVEIEAVGTSSKSTAKQIPKVIPSINFQTRNGRFRSLPFIRMKRNAETHLNRNGREAEKPEIKVEVDNTRPKKTLNLKIVYGKVETPYSQSEAIPLSNFGMTSKDDEFEKILRLGYRNHLLNKGKVSILQLNKNVSVYKPGEIKEDEEESSEEEIIGHRSSHQPQFVIGGRNEDTPWPWVVSRRMLMLEKGRVRIKLNLYFEIS
ncbi:venom serine protease 34 [Trichonephila inaurata madagascariensis]|uniref:Venom serine protease 34 n=1 Tax=Trichonephila inaurata madagascariensis TaxID=2747483 RepID=A0A8X6YK29_9ARAC|nr:venom serine protease 34 [Trichonephila inaurata madagascariensis]